MSLAQLRVKELHIALTSKAVDFSITKDIKFEVELGRRTLT